MIENLTTSPDWYWREDILRCRLLSQWSHGFFGRTHAPQTPPDLQKFFYDSNFPISAKAYHAKQVHGDRLAETTEFKNDEIIEADGVFALSAPEISVWTCSADCVPILIGDCHLGAVAAVHSGWRGTAKNILAKAIAKFKERGSDLDNLVAALGPAISGASYQVQTNVAEAVLSTITNPAKKSIGVFIDEKPGHCRLDLRLVQQQQLLELGLTNVAVAPYCTFQNPQQFFSYRRKTLEKLGNNIENKGNNQIQWSGIRSGIIQPQT